MMMSLVSVMVTAASVSLFEALVYVRMNEYRNIEGQGPSECRPVNKH